MLVETIPEMATVSTNFSLFYPMLMIVKYILHWETKKYNFYYEMQLLSSRIQLFW